ncbi:MULTISPECIES: HYC_CC_PP family protein [Flavobacteriaceae]|jgi:preprotein translocase subunit SecF|uniref:Preprotein translocase subunit SecF n=1 Tax=Mesonia maritima TaxID=1793873 RepID=A0ABU1K424_9FLAO|nr:MULTISPECIES: hypothetical protein [Flavobacteriaceae]MCC4227434.1 hypothetical protein [Zunongwangia profunda]MDR6299995.1 preprotein translocase subunit SecF [Mesonia maritima]
MKSFFHKIVSITLASLVFFATTSFTVDMHFCGQTLVDFSLIHNVKTCGMEKQQPKKNCESEVSKKSCCSDNQIMVEGQDNLKTSSNQLTFQQQAFVATFVYTYINLFDGLDKNIIPFKDYTPPYLIRDVQKLHETYLI